MYTASSLKVWMQLPTTSRCQSSYIYLFLYETSSERRFADSNADSCVCIFSAMTPLATHHRTPGQSDYPISRILFYAPNEASALSLNGCKCNPMAKKKWFALDWIHVKIRSAAVIQRWSDPLLDSSLFLSLSRAARDNLAKPISTSFMG